MSAALETEGPLGVDWLALCRRAAAAVSSVLADHPLTSDRAVTTGRGEGGDLALVIDRRAEDAVFAALEELALPLTVVSEERGRVEMGGGGEVHVIVDPIDGSLNAKRRLPHHALSIAVSSGPTMADVEFGYVFEPMTGEEWWAWRGHGAWLGETRVAPLAADATLEILGLESANPRIVAANAEALAATGARRLRVLGAIAMSLCYVAAARFDAMLSMYDCRSVDAAAGQLIVREAGGSVAFPDAGLALSDVGLDLEMRSRVIAAASPDLLATVSEAVSAEPPDRARREPRG